MASIFDEIGIDEDEIYEVIWIDDWEFLMIIDVARDSAEWNYGHKMPDWM